MSGMEDGKAEIGRLKAEIGRLRGLLAEREALLAKRNGELADLGAELKRITRTDGLSGALSRAAALEALEAERLRAERYGRPLSVILLDLDRFKLVNDMHGPAAGDEAIRRLAGICRDCLRGTDLLGRYGGEEFLAILPEVGGEGALVAAERIRSAMQAERFAAGDARFTVTVSGGVAALEAKWDLDRFLANADAALYKAKEGGRNRIAAYGRAAHDARH